MNEIIVETKLCKQCGLSFDITDKDRAFYDKISPVFAGQTYTIPNPTRCPACRQQRRLAFRNERTLYKRTCDLTGKDIVSMYAPGVPYKVYDQSARESDKRDAMQYATSFQSGISFFRQLDALSHAVPRKALYNFGNENSEFNNDTDHCRNTYLCFFSNDVQDSYYIHGYKVKDSMDIGWSDQIECCYECFNCSSLYKCFYCYDCDGGADLFACQHCVSCKNCLGCVSQRNKQYMIFNKQYSPQEYATEFDKIIKTMSLADIKQKVRELQLATPVLYASMSGSKDCIGDFIYNSHNCTYCYEATDMNDCKYCCQCARTSNMYDADNTGNGEGLMLETLQCDYGFRILFSISIAQSENIYYSQFLHNCKHCFACIGLRDKSYCIFNKQYTPSEYEKEVSRIVGEMITDGSRGAFFPPSMSPFGYNETIAMEYFPLSKEEALMKGYKRSDYEAPFPKVDKIIKAADLPRDISLMNDEILHQAIECEVTHKPFRIIKPELEFYRKYNVPIPHRHPDQRHKDRMALRNPRNLRDRTCAKCGVDIKTTYAPERPEIVYCEACYNKEVF